MSDINVYHHPESQVNANGLTLNYDYFGDISHPPIILIMGLATQMIHWDDDFCTLLASQGYWVIRFDNRDMGRSSWLRDQKSPGMLDFLANVLFKTKLEAPYLLNDMAKDTLGLMDALDIKAAHIVGVSMGGMIAQCMAISAPERVLSLTSIMSTTGARDLPKAKASVSLSLLKSVPKDLDDYLEHGQNVWKVLQGEVFPFDAQSTEKKLRLAHQRGINRAGVARQLSAIIDSPDRSTSLCDLKMPCLVMHGDMDPLVPVGHGHATAEAIPGSRLKIFAGMGHTLPRQLWPSFIREINNLIKQD